MSAFVLSLRKNEICNDGVFIGLEWCLNEVLDNVLVHSQAGKGFVMAQYHTSNKLFSVCVFDYGIGIYNSFLNSKHHPKTRADAITLALQEKVTRDDTIGQGNGLWGLHQIIEENGGSLKVISDGAYYQCGFDDSSDNNPVFHDKGNTFIFDKRIGTTLIDFQLDTSCSIDVGKALNGSTVIDLWQENLENDNGDFVIDVFNVSQGTGTRPAALEVRNIALNIALNEKKKVIFDFKNVNTLGSSYADELIGKIIAKYGIIFFNKKFEIINISKSNADILERSVKLRMAQSYYDASIEDDFQG